MSEHVSLDIPKPVTAEFVAATLERLIADIVPQVGSAGEAIETVIMAIAPRVALTPGSPVPVYVESDRLPLRALHSGYAQHIRDGHITGWFHVADEDLEDCMIALAAIARAKALGEHFNPAVLAAVDAWINRRLAIPPDLRIH